MLRSPVTLFATLVSALAIAASSLLAEPQHDTAADDLLHGCTIVFANVRDYRPSVELCSPLSG